MYPRRSVDINTSLGFKSKMLLGADATVANCKQYLTCGLKGFVSVGHGNTNFIALADGTLDAAWFNNVANQALKPAVVYFNSCQVHNDPLKSAVMKAGARTFIGGIVNLLIGPSEEVCKCFWGKALKTTTPMGDALQTCEKEKYPSEGAHGITGATGPFKVSIPCLRAPIPCLRAPIPRCPPAPIIRCVSAPLAPPIREPIREEPLVPVVIMVPKETAAAWMAYGEQEVSKEEAYEYALQAAEEAYCATLEELGMSGEYSRVSRHQRLQTWPVRSSCNRIECHPEERPLSH